MGVGLLFMAWTALYSKITQVVMLQMRKKFLFNVIIDLLYWSSMSSDLNPIESLWGALVREIYAGSNQYENAENLKQAI
eukprot:IDg9956t1